MVQVNENTRSERQIRPPRKLKSPAEPLVQAGPTTVINVPKGSPGKMIHVPHPGVPGAFLAVNVPATARPGQAMLVPVPREAAIAPARVAAPSDAARSKARSAGGWSTGAKVAAGTAAVVGVGGAAVGGVVLGESIAEHGLDATVDAVGDGFGDAGEAIGDFAVDAGDWIGDAAESTGDFIMDLF